MLAGVPMPWMTEWAGPFPIFAAEASGAHLTDVDGNEYVDFCLGDTGAMTGHSPEPATAAIAAGSRRGITLMLPSEDSVAVGAELARRFGLPYWQFALTATDANRFALRLARAITGRPKVAGLLLVLPRLRGRGARRRRRGRGPRPARTTSGPRWTRR